MKIFPWATLSFISWLRGEDCEILHPNKYDEEGKYNALDIFRLFIGAKSSEIMVVQYFSFSHDGSTKL